MRFICVYGIPDCGKSHVLDSVYKSLTSTVPVGFCSNPIDHKAHGLISDGVITKRAFIWSEGDGPYQIREGFSCLREQLKKGVNIDVFIFTARIHSKTFAIVKDEIDCVAREYSVDEDKDVFWYYKSAGYSGNDCKKGNSLPVIIANRYNDIAASDIKEMAFL